MTYSWSRSRKLSMALLVIAGGMTATSCRIASFNCSIVPGRRASPWNYWTFKMWELFLPHPVLFRSIYVWKDNCFYDLFYKLLLSKLTSCGVDVRMTGQWRLGENFKRILRDLILILSRNLPSGTDKRHTHLSEERVVRQRHDLGTFRIQVDSVASTAPCSGRVILNAY